MSQKNRKISTDSPFIGPLVFTYTTSFLHQPSQIQFQSLSFYIDSVQISKIILRFPSSLILQCRRLTVKNRSLFQHSRFWCIKQMRTLFRELEMCRYSTISVFRAALKEYLMYEKNVNKWICRSGNDIHNHTVKKRVE